MSGIKSIFKLIGIGARLMPAQLREILARDRAEQRQQMAQRIRIDFARGADITLPGGQIGHDHKLAGMPVGVGARPLMQIAQMAMATGSHSMTSL